MERCYFEECLEVSWFRGLMESLTPVCAYSCTLKRERCYFEELWEVSWSRGLLESLATVYAYIGSLKRERCYFEKGWKYVGLLFSWRASPQFVLIAVFRKGDVPFLRAGD